LPTNVKILRGTARAHRLNRAEPRPKPGAPAMPAALSADARPTWRWLVRLLRPMRVLTKSDAAVLLLAAVRLSDYLRLRRLVEAEGTTYATTTARGSSMHRQRPEVALMIAAWRDTTRILVEFGLSPSARSRVAVAAAATTNADDLEDFLAPPARGRRGGQHEARGALRQARPDGPGRPAGLGTLRPRLARGP
jgi:P27 family predicted phage terminase small subunit